MAGKVKSKPKSEKPPMTVEEANKVNPGGGALIEAAERRKAIHQAFVQRVLEDLDLADKVDQLRALPIEDKKAILLQLNFAGLSISDGARVLDIGLTTANRWFRENPEQIQTLIRSTLSSESLKEVGPTWARLQELRYSANAETSRKAALDCLAVAGMNPHGPSGITVNVNAQNAQLAIVPVDSLEAELRQLAAALGPNAEKIVEAELISVKDFHGNASRKAPAPSPVPGGDAGEAEGPADGAAPEEIQPAD